MNASAAALAVTDTPPLLEILASRRAQAQNRDAAQNGAMAQGTMVYWLARAAKELREAAGRKQVHVAASMSKDQSTVYRFEQGGTVPRELDLFIAAYADDLEIEPMQIWARALELWKEDGQQATVHDLLTERDATVVSLPGPPAALRRQGKAQSPSAPSRRRRRSAEGAGD